MALQLFNDADFLAPFFGNLHNVNQQWAADRNLAEATRPTLLDVQEKAQSFEIAADLPGVSKENIKLHVEGDVLSLAVDRKTQKQEEKTENGIKVHRMERSSGFMKRSLRLPESADLSQIQARYQDGVLRLDIPKREEASRSRVIPIE